MPPKKFIRKVVEISVFHLSVGLTDEHIYSSSSNDGKREYCPVRGSFFKSKAAFRTSAWKRIYIINHVMFSVWIYSYKYDIMISSTHTLSNWIYLASLFLSCLILMYKKRACCSYNCDDTFCYQLPPQNEADVYNDHYITRSSNFFKKRNHIIQLKKVGN